MTSQPGTPPPLALRPPSNRVDPRCRWWWTVQVALVVAAVLIPLLVVALFFVSLLAVVAAAWLLLGIAAVFLVPRVRWSIHRWEETDTAVYSRSGLFWEEWRAAPLSRVQTVDKTRGPLERLFGLATVVVTTASSRGAVRIRSLDADLAEELAQRLTVIAEGDQRDAT
ncbi:PH domain-containing protein [Dietzia aerolata]|uniref:PH domain-containing protein n=1 Tax=Dietzia aerolata TaxID=595984 RepID=A0ABV5JQ78_9ACTN